MKLKISKFIDNIPDFSVISQAEQVKCLAYCYIKLENKDIFTKENIKTYFELANSPPPTNIHNVFTKLRRDKVFIHVEAGDRLNRDIIKELDNDFPNLKKHIYEEGFEWIYTEGENYDIYKNIKSIVNKAENEVFIVDGYLDKSLYDLYFDDISGIKLKFLTNPPNEKSKNKSIDKFLIVAKLWKNHKNNELDIRCAKIHDRLIFIDNKECWILGASIKDAGNKPTYLIRIKSVDKFYSVYSKIFNKNESILN